MTILQTLRRFYRYARRDRWVALLAGLCLALNIATELVAIWTFSVITDHALVPGKLGGLVQPAAIWIAMSVVGGLTTYAGSVLSAVVTERFVLRLRDATYAQVQRLPPDFHQDHETGDLVARMSSDVDALEQFVGSGVIHAFVTVTSVVAYAVAASIVRWDLAIVTFAVAPVFWLAAKGLSRILRLASRSERAANADVISKVEEGVSNFTVIRAYNQQAADQRRFHVAGVSLLRARLAEARAQSAYQPFVGFIEILSTLGVLAMGTWEISQGRITLGGLIAFVGYIGYLYPHIQDLGNLSLTANAAAAAGERLAEVLDAEVTIDDAAVPESLRSDRSPAARRPRHLHLNHLSFTYPRARRPALADVTATLPAGGFVAITGASGSGKTTLAQLLLRFHDPTSGAIHLGDTDIRDLALDELRELVTWLPQEATIFAGTVGENIAFGRPTATDDQIRAAARATDCAGFIEELPDGYETDLSSRGTNLSGGQRQRIAIARALLRDSPIVVLDEPTAALDSATAAQVMGPLHELMTDRTTVLITHDLRLTREAETILVLDEGRLVESGDHTALMALGGCYAGLHELGFAAEAVPTAG